MLPPNNLDHRKRSSIFGLFGFLDWIEGRKNLFTSKRSDIVNNSNVRVANFADRTTFIQTLENYEPPKNRKRINKKYIHFLVHKNKNK